MIGMNWKIRACTGSGGGGFSFCWKNIVQLGDTTTNYQIAPGDRIYVPSRSLLETLTFGHCDKGPCNGAHSPCSLPADPGAACDRHAVSEAPTTLPEEIPAPLFHPMKREKK